MGRQFKSVKNKRKKFPIPVWYWFAISGIIIASFVMGLYIASIVNVLTLFFMLFQKKIYEESN